MILARLKKKNNVCISLFYYENELDFPIYVSNQKFENWMNLLLIIDGDKSHYVSIKDFDRFMFHKNYFFCKSYLQCFSRKNLLTKRKEVCFSINGARSVRPEKGKIGFKNYSNKY